MHRKMRWLPGVLAAAVMLSGCSRRDDLPSETETEDRSTTVTSVTESTTHTEDTNGVLDEAGTMLSDAVDHGGDIVSDVIDGGEELVSDAVDDARDMMDGSDSTSESTMTETRR